MPSWIDGRDEDAGVGEEGVAARVIAGASATLAAVASEPVRNCRREGVGIMGERGDAKTGE